MKRILVTGAAGFIGSHLCEKLLAKRKQVIALDLPLDITDYTALEQVFKKGKIDRIIHLAARAGVRDSITNPEEYHRVNVEGTKNLLDLAITHRVKQFIFASSSSVYGTNEKLPFLEDDPIENIASPYAQTKKEGEKLCKQYHDDHGLNVTCLRFFTVYGQRGRKDMAPYKFTKSIIEGTPIEMYGDGSSTRDYTYVGDIVDGIVAALNKRHEFEIINLGSGHAVTLREFIAMLEEAIGKKAEIKQVGPVDGDVPATRADINKARSLLGYQPRISLEDGIRLFVDWYKKKMGA